MEGKLKCRSREREMRERDKGMGKRRAGEVRDDAMQVVGEVGNASEEEGLLVVDGS